MSSRLSSGEIDATDRFAQAFHRLYGHGGFSSDDHNIRDFPPRDQELIGLIARMQTDDQLYAEFRIELENRVNALGDIQFKVVASSPGVCVTLGYPSDAMLLAIHPSVTLPYSASRTQIRTRWSNTRLFSLSHNGAVPIEFDLDTLLGRE